MYLIKLLLSVHIRYSYNYTYKQILDTHIQVCEIVLLNRTGVVNDI